MASLYKRIKARALANVMPRSHGRFVKRSIVDEQMDERVAVLEMRLSRLESVLVKIGFTLESELMN